MIDIARKNTEILKNNLTVSERTEGAAYFASPIYDMDLDFLLIIPILLMFINIVPFLSVVSKYCNFESVEMANTFCAKQILWGENKPIYFNLQTLPIVHLKRNISNTGILNLNIYIEIRM